MPSPRPIIAITTDNGVNARGLPRYESYTAYAAAVARAGGTPVLLPQESQCIPAYLQLCHGLLFTGGDDPRMELFHPNTPTHPQASVMDPRRQQFEMKLLAALHHAPQRPVLGICWGMQLLALAAGGTLHQHLPDILGDTAAQVNHAGRTHTITPLVGDSVLVANQKSKIKNQKFRIVSSHHQAVAAPGTLRIVATAPDGVIEALDDPRKPYYLGVQWHPERGADDPLNQGLFTGLIAAAENFQRRAGVTDTKLMLD